jgi:nucleotide-binding universal stress UspA family protein
MAILCGTDFSLPAREAADAAAALARRMNEPLVLLHALETLAEFRADWQTSAGHDSVIEFLQRRLAEEAARLRLSGVEVEEEFCAGEAADALVDRACRQGTSFVLLGPHGKSAASRLLLGSVSERVAQTAPVPALIVRDAAPFRDWDSGRPLHVAVGADLSPSAEGALQWAGEFARLGSSEVVVIHVAWPPGEYSRLGIESRMDLVTCHPEVEQVLTREITERLGTLAAHPSVRIRIQAGFGRRADHLAQIASDERSDLLVVGTHQRHGMRRLWHGSVSRGVLHLTQGNVAVVPVPAAGQLDLPEVRRILVPTDFSDVANLAIPYAYAVLADGGVVHLLHVIESEPGSEEAGTSEAQLEAALHALVPAAANRRDVRTEAVVIRGRRIGHAIAAAAERMGVDLVCIGSRGRSSLFGRNAGVVAQEVWRLSDRPLLVIRPPRESA